VTAAATHIVASYYPKKRNEWKLVEYMYLLTAIATYEYVSDKILHIMRYPLK